MGVRIKRSGDKGIRRFWYMRYLGDDGKMVERQTDVPVEGTPPPSLSSSDRGDAAFERSRARAEQAFELFDRERRKKNASEHLMQTLIEEKTGRKIVYVRIDELYAKWTSFPRRRKVSERRDQCSHALFGKFLEHCRKFPRGQGEPICFLYQVTPEMAQAFADELHKGICATTVRDHISLLSGTFRRLLPPGAENPFKEVIVQEDENETKIHRKPLTDEQLRAVYETAKRRPERFIYHIAVCAAQTGLRIGDVCCLKWQSVYLQEGHLSLKMRKPGTMVHVPIFDGLRGVLEERLAERNEDDIYVFPEAAAMYLHNHSGLIRRGKLLFAEALFGHCEGEEECVKAGDSTGDDRNKVLRAIEEAGFFARKKERITDVYLRYSRGESYNTISAETGLSRGQISGYLAEIEVLASIRLRPNGGKGRARRLSLAKTRQDHSKGRNASSTYGWHSLRANFVVQALFARIPEDLIKEIVGHAQFRTTKEYIHPTWKVFKEAWERNGTRSAITSKIDVVPSSAMTMTQEEALSLLRKTLTPEQIEALKVLDNNVAQQRQTTSREDN